MTARWAWTATSLLAPLIVSSSAAFESAGATRPTASIRPGARTNRRNKQIKVGPTQLDWSSLSATRTIGHDLDLAGCPRREGLSEAALSSEPQNKITTTRRIDFHFILSRPLLVSSPSQLQPRSRLRPQLADGELNSTELKFNFMRRLY